MKCNIEFVLKYLTEKGIKCKYLSPEWEDPFIKVYGCGLYDKNSIADFIRKHGYNCDID